MKKADTAGFEIRRALLSVSDKKEIVPLAQLLHELGVEIISTGGTAKLLRNHHIPLIEVSEVTGFPEIMDGRVKTLHPKIYGGILGRSNQDQAVLQQLEIDLIDLVIVNLYPFQETVANPACTLSDAIENIDIGGPAMLRAAAKNHARVTVVVDPNDYAMLMTQLKQHKIIPLQQRFALAIKAFRHTAEYDIAITNYLENLTEEPHDSHSTPFPAIYNFSYYKKQSLRYGENPHQQAAFYTEKNPRSGTIAAAQQLQGKELSYNNIADSDAALECVKEFHTQNACVIVKHGNPCGVALEATQLAAYHRAYRTDPTSSFGGIIAFNQELQATTAQAIIDNQFVEVIIAPHIAAHALTVLAAKPNIRVLQCGPWSNLAASQLDYKKIASALLVQQQDSIVSDPALFEVVSNRKPTAAELEDLNFAWIVAKHVKSNAIVYAKQNATIGIGAGQMSRITSAHVAGLKAEEAGLEVKGAVMASDAFFPFRDGIDTAAQCGITAVIQPGGSLKDAEVIQAANEANMAMIFTRLRHFRH